MTRKEKYQKRSSEDTDYRADKYYRKFYGKDVIVTRLGHINIVHLDHPDKQKIQKRIEEIIQEEMTGEGCFDDCPLCQEFQKHPHDIVYYDQNTEEMHY